MTTRQLRAQLNTPKRKYTLPLLIPRLRQPVLLKSLGSLATRFRHFRKTIEKQAPTHCNPDDHRRYHGEPDSPLDILAHL